MEVSGESQDPAAIVLGKIPLGGLTGFRAGLEVVQKREVLPRIGNRTPVVHLVASPFTVVLHGKQAHSVV
jgi:hypothetical protein